MLEYFKFPRSKNSVRREDASYHTRYHDLILIRREVGCDVR